MVKKVLSSSTPRTTPQRLGPLLTEDETAAYLGTTQRHVRELRRSGRLSYVMVGGKVRLAQSDLDAFIAARRVRASRA
jgi:excisionase family DNA binding protein